MSAFKRVLLKLSGEWFSGVNEKGFDKSTFEKVVETDGKYAYMMESSSIQYIIERNCKVTQIGGNLDNKVKYYFHVLPTNLS